MGRICCNGFALRGDELINNGNMVYYILNSFVVMILSLSIAFLAGTLAKNQKW